MLEMLINRFTDGNKAKFAAMLGIKPQTLGMWFVRNSLDAELIYSKCDGVSADWLLSGGQGEMMKSSHSVNYVDEGVKEEIIKLRTENDLLREIAGLKKRTGIASVG